MSLRTTTNRTHHHDYLSGDELSHLVCEGGGEGEEGEVGGGGAEEEGGGREGGGGEEGADGAGEEK